MFKKIILVLALIFMIVLPVFSQTGSYTTHNLFYLPNFGAYGLAEFNEYNAYMEIADNQIWANKTAIAGLDLSLYYLKTEINTQAKMETIWGVNLANDSELHTQNTDTDLDATFEATFFKKADSIGDIGDVDLTDIANLKILKYNSTSGNWECEDESGGGATTFTGLTDTPANYTGQAGLYAKVNAGETALEFGTPGGGGTVTTSGTPVANDIARFTGATIIEGLSYTEFKAALDLEIGTDVQAYSADNAFRTDKLSAFAATTSAELAGVISDETGSGLLVYGTSPNITTPTGIVKGDVGLGNVENLKVNLTATIAPTVSNDNTQGYAIGSRWIDVTADKEYVALDVSTGAAVWTETTGAGGGASQLSDLSDVNTSTPTNKYVLVADGVDFESRQLTSDDLSDVASIAMLDEAETVTGYWKFTGGFVTLLASDTPTSAPYFSFQRARDGDPTADVSSEDYLGTYLFYGYYTDGYDLGATIRAIVDGTPGNADMPGRLEFSTTPDGSATPALRMAIDNAGNIKMGDGVWTNYVNVSNAGVLTFEGTASINEPLSIMASTTSAELAGVISDEIGAGKLRFDTAVTAKTTTATLNVNEAGTILVSAAGGAYTITLPTAVGNTGLTYHFVKTDANYTLITIDGDGTETINYENSTGTPVLTYARLNTYCAEVTMVSDGANWQVINEKMGQVPSCNLHTSAIQYDITASTYIYVELDTAEYDIGGNSDLTTWESGTATSTSAGHLVDSTAAFVSDMVGKRVKNTTDTTYTYITAVNSGTDVSVRDNIFVNTEAYEIKKSRYVIPISGKYLLCMQIHTDITGMVADKEYNVRCYANNTTNKLNHVTQSSIVGYCDVTSSKIIAFAKDDVVTLKVYFPVGVNTVDLSYGAGVTYMSLHLISKD